MKRGSKTNSHFHLLHDICYMKLNLNSMTAPFGPVVASNSGSDTSEECHPCGRAGEGGGAGPGWMDGWLSGGD